MGGDGRAALPGLVVTACLAALVALVALGVRSWTTGGELRPFRTASVEGDRLVLTYVDGACRSSEHVAVHEAPDVVTVTIRTRTLAFSCSDANEEYTVEVVLDAPLGGRDLVDGAVR